MILLTGEIVLLGLKKSIICAAKMLCEYPSVTKYTKNYKLKFKKNDNIELSQIFAFKTVSYFNLLPLHFVGKIYLQVLDSA